MALNKSQKLIRYSLYGLLGAGVLAVAVYGLIIRPVQIHNQEQAFTKAETQLDTLATQIQATIGKADETKKEKTCDRANLKSEKGPLGCGITLSILYKNKNDQDANDLMLKTASLNSASLRTGSGASHGTSFVPKATQPGTQIFYQDLAGISQLTCAISYRYPSALDQNAIPENESFAIGLSCGGPAMKEFFPLRD